mmetsp:Transcript_18597/g.40717  ORF Transcript_18597/g.40717 Transcript_18597/m.40717 type:complete len:239 (-) Transcript_18597:1915-2631(-)
MVSSCGCTSIGKVSPAGSSAGVRGLSATLIVHGTLLGLIILKLARMPIISLSGSASATTGSAGGGAPLPAGGAGGSLSGGPISAMTAPKVNTRLRSANTFDSRCSGSSALTICCSSKMEPKSSVLMPGMQDSPATSYGMPPGWSEGSRSCTWMPSISTYVRAFCARNVTLTLSVSPGSTTPSGGLMKKLPSCIPSGTSSSSLPLPLPFFGGSFFASLPFLSFPEASSSPSCANSCSSP